MIHVNVRGLVVRESGNGKELIIQLRKKRESLRYMNFQAVELMSMKAWR